MMKQAKLLIKFTNASNDDGTVWYTIQVFNSLQDQSWIFKARYSQMRQIHEKCILTARKNDLAEFPHRKLFGNMKEDFIQKRRKQLENYYNTILRSVDIIELPDLLKFLNTNKPKKQIIPKMEDKHIEDQVISINKQKVLKKRFEEIVSQTTEKMVISNDFFDEIDDETRRKFNQQVQNMKLQLKSSLLEEIKMKIQLQAQQDNDVEYWPMFFKDQHQNKLNSISTIKNCLSKVTQKQITEHLQIVKIL